MIEPILLTIDLECPAEHAFEVWTGGISSWWPPDHTVSAEAGVEVVLEQRAGGRIYERTRAGVEHEWGVVTAWEPPHRFVYLWHLRRDRADATEVEVRFVEVDTGRSRVEIEHRGWERLGAGGREWRDRNLGGWSTLLPHFVLRASTPTYLADEKVDAESALEETFGTLPDLEVPGRDEWERGPDPA